MPGTSTDSTGTRWNHTIVRGTTWGPHEVTITDSGSPVDLTGAAVFGGVLVDDIEVVDVTVTVTDAPNGVFECQMSDLVTQTLPAGGGTLILSMVDTLGRVTELVRGAVRTLPGLTDHT